MATAETYHFTDDNDDNEDGKTLTKIDDNDNNGDLWPGQTLVFVNIRTVVSDDDDLVISLASSCYARSSHATKSAQSRSKRRGLHTHDSLFHASLNGRQQSFHSNRKDTRLPHNP